MTQLSTALRPIEFKRFMACWATGVAVVTCTADDGRPVGCTVNAVTSVSLTPALLLVSLAEDSRTLRAIQARQRFGVNLLPARRLDLARRFAGGDPHERFTGVEHDLMDGVPVLADIVIATVCVPRQWVTVADHVLVIAEPVWCRPAPRQPPLVSFDRGYWSLSPSALLGEH